jgi:hypothetical protein
MSKKMKLMLVGVLLLVLVGGWLLSQERQELTAVPEIN